MKLALAERYVQGVSTRKVAAITEELCGFEVTSAQVSRAAAERDGAFAAWRERPLGEFPYVLLDARDEKARTDGPVRDVAVFTAVGIDPSGHRQVLGPGEAWGAGVAASDNAEGRSLGSPYPRRRSAGGRSFKVSFDGASRECG